MHGVRTACFYQRTNEIAVAPFACEIDRRGRALLASLDLAQIERLAHMAPGLADQDDAVAFALERDGRHVPHVAQQADAPDRRRRQDRLAVGLVVERAIAG